MIGSRADGAAGPADAGRPAEPLRPRAPGRIDQVLISGGNFTPKRLEQIVEGLSEVCVDVSLIPAQAIELAPNYQVNLLGTVRS